METEEILEMVVREMTEKALMERREDVDSGDQELSDELSGAVARTRATFHR